MEGKPLPARRQGIIQPPRNPQVTASNHDFAASLPAHLRDGHGHGVLPVPLGCSPVNVVTCLILPVYEVIRTATPCGKDTIACEHKTPFVQ